MPSCGSLFSIRIPFLILICLSAVPLAPAQGAKHADPNKLVRDSDGDHVQERNEWFFRGRLIPGKNSAELRRRAYLAKLKLRTQHAAALAPKASATATAWFGRASFAPASFSSGSWVPLGPMPLASDATGNGTQDYHQVSGRATAVAIDPADQSGNTVYIGGAQSGVWKSTNAATSTANNVAWTPITDDEATLSIGAIAIQPGNTNPAQSVILAATGEADNSGDSYFGLGILRSADAGAIWTLISTANTGALSFSGLGGTRMAFSTASGQMSTVVSAMATTSEGLTDGAITAGTTRGLYTSLDAGQSWNYNALFDPGGTATDATSATSVVYNASAAQFFAAVRYHGFYSSPDGVNWTRLSAQPGGATLGSAACPSQSPSNNYACPIYRGEITVVPGRNEMYAWFISFSSNGSTVDGGMWQSTNGGTSWVSISDSGVTNCGDFDGCGVQQGSYNLELLAVPNGTSTDLYAGAINLYKCQITSQNPDCSGSSFLNLTHVYGCDPIGAPAHVHPDQHALAYAIPGSGGDSGNALMYFANDGGIYRALDGFFGLSTGLCSGTNLFDDLNQNLGSMTQFVSFSQHPTDQNTLLGGTQDNGSPASGQSTTNPSWGNVLGGDGGYNAIDPNSPLNFYASNPDVPPGGLGVQRCSSGVNCNDSGFDFVVTSSMLAGDDGAFYFPYILDPASSSAMLVGTCRVWRGPRTGGAFTVLSPNFDTLGSGTCTGQEVNQVRGLAVGGQPDSNGSSVIYATTSGLGPIDGVLSTPAGGRVWVTRYATGGVPTFYDVTNNGPQGNINPNQFPISSVALDSTDATGQTAYVTVMGFTGGTGHVWQTLDAGTAWTDFTGNLPDSPANAVVVSKDLAQVFVATDVGVFAASTSLPVVWTELGPDPTTDQPNFLPNVAVTAIAIFTYDGQELLRASTYGRGIWEFNLLLTPGFQISIPSSPLTIFSGQTAAWNGTITALNGYASDVTLSCVPGSTAPPANCLATPSPLLPGDGTMFTLTASGAVGNYSFILQGVGSDPDSFTEAVPLTLQIANLATSPDFILQPFTLPEMNVGSAGTSATLSISSQDGFSNSVALSCSITNHPGSCSISPTSVNSYPAYPIVTVNAAGFIAGSYTLTVTGTSGSDVHSQSATLNVGDYSISGTQALTVAPAGQGTANLTLTASLFYVGTINVTCDPSSLPGSQCVLTPSNSTTLVRGGTASLVVTVNVPSNAAAGIYNLNINTQDTTGAPTHAFTVVLTVAPDFIVSSSTTTQTVTAGQTSGSYALAIQPVGSSFDSAVTLACTSGLPAGAQCLFSPSGPQTPGASAVDVVMSISTAARSATSRPAHAAILYAFWFAWPALVIVWGGLDSRRGKRARSRRGAISLLILLVFSLLSCSGVSSGGTGMTGNPTTYRITVTGTSPGAAADAGQSVQVILIVD